MTDLLFSEDGDIVMKHNGDIALTSDYGTSNTRIKGYNAYTSKARDYAQQAFIRIMTTIGDYEVYPDLGASLEDNLVGLPNTPETAALGETLIRSALTRGDSPLKNIQIDIKSVPISPQAIRFDVFMTIGSKTEMVLSIKQSLNTTFALNQ